MRILAFTLVFIFSSLQALWALVPIGEEASQPPLQLVASEEPIDPNYIIGVKNKSFLALESLIEALEAQSKLKVKRVKNIEIIPFGERIGVRLTIVSANKILSVLMDAKTGELLELKG